MNALKFMLEKGPFVMVAEALTHILTNAEGSVYHRCIYPIIVFTVVGIVRYVLLQNDAKGDGWTRKET